MPKAYQIILCTCPDQKSAQNIAAILIRDQLAACVNIMPGITSIYSWQGKLETASENLLIIKTRIDKFRDIESSICSNHPYELPEIIAVPIERGLPEYLQWIDTCLSAE